MRWNSHDGARAVVHQYIVCDPDGDRFPCQWVARTYSRIHTELFCARHISCGNRGFLAVANKGLKCRIIFTKRKADGVLRCKADIAHAKEGIGAGCVDVDLIQPCNRRIELEAQLDPATLANPVALHESNRLRPTLQFVEVVQ